MKRLHIFIAAALCSGLILQAVRSARAEGDQNAMDMGSFAAQKITLERAMEQKVRDVLNNMLGPGKAQVVVNLTINPTFTETLKIDPSQKSGGLAQSKYLWADPRNSGPYVLPGFSANGQSEAIKGESLMGPVSYSRSLLPFAQMIQRLDAILLVNPLLSNERVEEVKNTVSQLLGIETKRGDTLSVMKTSMIAPWKQVLLLPETQFKLALWLFVGTVGLLSLLMVYKAALAIAGAMTSVGTDVRNASHSVSMSVNPGERGRLDESGATKPVGLLENGTEKSDGKDVKALPAPSGHESSQAMFAFVTDKNLPGTIEFIATQSPKMASFIITSLDSSLIESVLQALPEDFKIQVLTLMGRPLVISKQEKEDVVRQMQEFLQSYLDTPQQLQRLFTSASPELQQKILEQIQAVQPEMAEVMRSRMVHFEDIGQFPEDDRVVIASTVDIATMALALRGAPDELVKALLGPLPKGLRAQVEQSIRLQGPQPIAKVNKARHAVVLKIIELKNLGRLSSSASNGTVV